MKDQEFYFINTAFTDAMTILLSKKIGVPGRLQTRNESNLGSEIELKSFAAVWELGPGQIFEQLFLPELYENMLS